MNELTHHLLNRARAGSEGALDELFELHRGRLAAGLRRRYGIAPGALEDLIQETLLKAFRNLERFEYRGQGSFLAWLFTGASQEWKKNQRYLHAQKRDIGRQFVLPEESHRAPEHGGPSPSKVARGNELEELLYRLMEDLPPAERRALELRRLLDLSYGEIRVELGLPSEGAVRSLLSRAQVRLAGQLELEEARRGS